jgi:hypothetical protein
VASPRSLSHAGAMNENTAIKALAAPGAALILIGIGYAYGLVGGCPRQTAENALPRDATLIAAGVMLAGATAVGGYRAGSQRRRE